MANQPTHLYTRSGDNGTTKLSGPKRILKDSARITCLGDLDELIAHIGVIRSHCTTDPIMGFLGEIQALLLELTTELTQPASSRLVHAHTARLEQFIDRRQEDLPPLEHTALPGGCPPAAHCHLARAVCRRAERNLFRLSRTEHVNSASLQFINRLSDLLFVLARTLNQRAGTAETPWKPRNRERV